jgi:MFS transporter, NNP family, nitrate/nitrite transporter
MRFKGTPQQGLFGATLGFFIGFAAVSLFGPTAKKLQDLMQLTPMMVGFLVAMPSLSGSLLRIPFAAWVDTTGGRKPFLVLLVTSVIGMLGLTAMIFLLYPDRMSGSLYPLLLVLGLLSGCGIATFSVGIGQVSYWFPQSRQGRALGAFAGIGNLAPGIFSLLLPLALAAWGLSGSYLVWLLFLIAGTILYFYTGRNAWYFQAREQGTDMKKARSIAQGQGQEIFPAKSTKDSLLQSAKVWKTWLLVGIYFHHLRRFHCHDFLAAHFLDLLLLAQRHNRGCADGGLLADRFADPHLRRIAWLTAWAAKRLPSSPFLSCWPELC